jgi:hypothetical protein
MDYTNIPTGLKITTQIPLNVKEFCKDEATLAYLGVDDNLAFTYHDQLEVLCLAEKSIYVWREVQVGEENTGLVPLDFTYPTGLSNLYDINYSGKKYNFFLKEYITTDTLQDLIKIENVGTGADVYKGFNSTTNKHEIKTVIIDSQLSSGESFVRDIQENTNDITVRVKKLISNNLTISSTNEEVRIETPETASIPALYVNNLYIPTEAEFLAGNTKGEGTLAKPFTDTVTAYVAGVPTITPNTALQNALDAYVGTGTRLSPELLGQQIIVQDKGVGSHTFGGDLNYSNLNLKLEGDLYCSTSDYIVDMDNATYFNSENSRIAIEIAEGKLLQYDNSLGFRNSGNTSVAPPSYSSGRIIELKGEGTVFCNYNGAENLTRYILNTDGNNNDDGLHFYIKCKLRADFQGVYFMKNKGRVDFYNNIQSGTFLGVINTSIKAFHMTGGQIRFFEQGSISISSDLSGREYGITFEPLDSGVGYCEFALNSARVGGNCNYCFVKLNNQPVSFLAFNSASNYGFSTTLPGDLVPVDGLFENLGIDKWSIEFKNNIFSYTGINFDKVDLTQGNNISSVNFIGNNVVEVLIKHDDRNAAILAGLPLYSAYIKTSGVAYPSTSGWVRDIVLPI